MLGQRPTWRQRTQVRVDQRLHLWQVHRLHSLDVRHELSPFVIISERIITVSLWKGAGEEIAVLWPNTKRTTADRTGRTAACRRLTRRSKAHQQLRGGGDFDNISVRRTGSCYASSVGCHEYR